MYKWGLFLLVYSISSALTNLDSVLKSRDITLPMKLHEVKLRSSTGLPSGDIWLWELDQKGGMPKNWCLQTIVLEKTPESPLDIKEIKLVNSKGNQA